MNFLIVSANIWLGFLDQVAVDPFQLYKGLLVVNIHFFGSAAIFRPTSACFYGSVGPLGPVRDNQLCHRSSLITVFRRRRIRFRVSVNAES
jgi:hypothetical protein